MNNPRRKRIADIVSKLQELDEELQALRNEIEEIKDEEQEYLDNIPENLQTSEKYEKSENAIYCLESAIDSIDYIDIEEIAGHLEESAE